MSILALDLATKTGYAILRDDNRIESGVVSFALRAREQDGVMFVRFKAWLVELKQCHTFTELIYERLDGHTQATPRIYCGMVALLQVFGEHHRIPYRGIPVSTVKKQWTGNGHADKDAMIAQCRALGFSPKDDNEADAIALLHVATGRAPILLPTGTTGKRSKLPPTVVVCDGAQPF